MSGTVAHIAHLLFGGSCGISSPLYGICVCSCLSFVDVETCSFSASTIHRERGVRLVGLARQIQVLTQCLFLAVTVALLVLWNMEIAGVRVGKRSLLGSESSQSKRHVPRFLNSDSFPMCDTSLGLPLRVTGRPRPCLDLLPRMCLDVFSPFSPSRWTVRAPWSFACFFSCLLLLRGLFC